MSFVAAIEFHARYRPAAPALFFPDAQAKPITYGELLSVVQCICSRIAAAGLVRGDCVAIELKNDFRHALLLIACAHSGIATVSSAPEPIAATVALKAVFQDKARALQGAAAGVAAILVEESWEQPSPDDLSPMGEPNCRPDDLCRIMLTSGSTGQPKGVALTYAMVEERVHSYLWAFGSDLPDHRNLLCGMKLSTSLGFGFLFYLLARGGLFCSDSVDFQKIENAIEACEIKALVTTPYTLTELLKYMHSSGKAMQRLPLVMTAGSLVSPELAKTIRQRLTDRLVIFYGTTETGVIASIASEATAGCVGAVVPGRRVAIVGADGAPVSRGQIGKIRVSATTGPLPFYDAADWREGSAKAFFEPGDVGSMTEKGELVVLGREDGIINAGGTKTTPEIIEQSLLSAPGIYDCGVVSRNDALGIGRIIACIVLSPSFNQQSFMAYCEANILRDFLPSKFVILKMIPRTANNKIDRAALVKQAV